MPTVLGVDSSTQSTKVELRDADDGRLLASGRAIHRPTAPPRSEQEPADWWSALAQAVGLAQIREPVGAIAIAAQQHGMVVLDASDEVIRPAKLWNDTESASEADELVDQLDPRRWAERTGSVPVASFTVTKLKWLADHEPANFARTARILLPHDWLTSKLTDRYTTDRGDASGTGYFSPADGVWQAELLELVDDTRSADHWRACLPEVLGPIDSAGPATSQALDELGLAGSPIVAPGTGDNMAAALGSGLRQGDVAISLGTSGTVYAVADAPTADASGAVAGFCDASGRYLPLVCVLNATGVTDTFARLLGLDAGAFASAALSAPEGSGGVILVPHLSGERTPNRPDATGTLVGLRPNATREQVARAAHEGVVCGLLDGLDALAAAGVPVDAGRLLLIGGGARSGAYRQIVADLAGREITVPDDREHVATGACVQAAAVLHGRPVDDVAKAWGLADGASIHPHPSARAGEVRSAYATVRG